VKASAQKSQENCPAETTPRNNKQREDQNRALKKDDDHLFCRGLPIQRELKQNVVFVLNSFKVSGNFAFNSGKLPAGRYIKLPFVFLLFFPF
jgi:hypothetical protein